MTGMIFARRVVFDAKCNDRSTSIMIFARMTTKLMTMTLYDFDAVRRSSDDAMKMA